MTTIFCPYCKQYYSSHMHVCPQALPDTFNLALKPEQWKLIFERVQACVDGSTDRFWQAMQELERQYEELKQKDWFKYN